MFFYWFISRAARGPIPWYELVAWAISAFAIRPLVYRVRAAWFSLLVRYYTQGAVMALLRGDHFGAQEKSRRAVRAVSQTCLDARVPMALAFMVHGKYEDAARVAGRARDEYENRVAAKKLFERIGLFYPSRD